MCADGRLFPYDRHVVKAALFHADTHGLSEVVILGDKCLPSVNVCLIRICFEGYRD